MVLDYDDDGFLIQAGDLGIVRETDTGFVASTAVGAVSDVATYTDYGELDTYTASFGGGDVYAVELVRDPAGRIDSKVETV